MAVTAIVVAMLAAAAADRDRHGFNAAARDARAAIVDRVETCIALLRGTAGLMASAPATVASFRRFVDRLSLRQQYRGILGIGFSRRVAAGERQALEEEMRREGHAGFRVWPPGERDELHSIVFLEPLDQRNRAAIGYDMYTNDVRRAAMARARDEGRPAASAVVELVQEIDERKQPGFLIYLPVYRGGGVSETLDERRASLAGFAYSPVRAVDFLSTAFAAPPPLRLEVFHGADPASGTLLYAIGEPVRHARFESRSTVDVAGQPWTFVFQSRSTYADALAAPAGVALAGLLLSLLLAFLVAREKRARLELQGALGRFSAFMQHSPDSVFLKDENGRYVFVNRAAEALLGTRDWAGRTDTDFVPAAARDIRAHDEEVLRSGEPRWYDLRLPAAGGERHLRTVKFPLRDAAGTRYIGAITTDVTEQRRSEEELQLVTDTMSAGMVRVSRELRYLWVNRVFASWAGRRPQDLVGRHIAEVIGEKGVEVLQLYSDELRAGRRVEYERLARFPGLGARWIYSVAEPTFDASGRPDGWVAVISDIHERKQAQEALRESDRRKDEFLAMLAHELRNPLAPIRNAVTLLGQEAELPPRVEWTRAVIERQVGQMTRLIDDLLDIARITSGKLLIRREPVALGAVIDIALETSRPHIDAAEQRLSVHLEPRDAWLHADRTRLAQVFSNLLNNAAKYTPRGGSIALGARREGAELVISVEDSGRGFPPQMAQKLFEPFSQWSGAGQDAGAHEGGLGIGLALVRGIVELHGGRVEAASDGPGKGSRFTVRLPASAPAGGASLLRETKPTPASGWKVLVADDNRDAADTLARILAIYGHDVRVAYDGRAALEECRRFAPHVAVLDVGMPLADGYEVARQLRAADGAWPKLIALTGWGQESDRTRALAAGFDHHLTKPCDPQSLHELIVKSCTEARV
jgi:PAS domain S-box-containing protein